jgi:hypothetical protein
MGPRNLLASVGRLRGPREPRHCVYDSSELQICEQQRGSPFIPWRDCDVSHCSSSWNRCYSLDRTWMRAGFPTKVLLYHTHFAVGHTFKYADTMEVPKAQQIKTEKDTMYDSCLEHRHSYVRKNAVFAVYTIHREFENLIPDAPELLIFAGLQGRSTICD